MMIDLLRTLGFLLLGGLFVWAGVQHFLIFKEVVAQMAAKRVPASALLLTAGSIVELAGGLCLILGIARPYAAAALIAFTIAASLLMLDFWRCSGAERAPLQSAFLTNVALIGGLLLAATSAG